MIIPYGRFGTTHLQRFLTFEDGADWCSRNVGKELSLVCVIAQKSVVLKYAFISLPCLITFLYKRNVTLCYEWCQCDISWFSIQLGEAKGSFSCYLVLKSIPFANKQEGRISDFMDIDMWEGHKCYYICYLSPRQWEMTKINDLSRSSVYPYEITKFC
jgi:hypothetical protein